MISHNLKFKKQVKKTEVKKNVKKISEFSRQSLRDFWGRFRHSYFSSSLLGIVGSLQDIRTEIFSPSNLRTYWKKRLRKEQNLNFIRYFEVMDFVNQFTSRRKRKFCQQNSSKMNRPSSIMKTNKAVRIAFLIHATPSAVFRIWWLWNS